MSQADDPRPDLPGAGGPPVEGARWAVVKVWAWCGAIVLLLCAAAVATWLVVRVQTAVSARSQAAQQVIEVIEPAPEAPAAVAPVAASAPDPAPMSVPVEAPPPAVAPSPPEAAPAPLEPAPQEAPSRRPLLMHR